MSKKNLLSLFMLMQLSGVLGCASVVRNSTKGALEAIRQQKDQVDQDKQDSITRGTAGEMTRGALDALITGQPPPQAEHLEARQGGMPTQGQSGPGGGTPAVANKSGPGGGTPAAAKPSEGAPATGGSGVVASGPTSVLASQVTRGLSMELERQLGADGTGPLARSMSAAAGQVASSVIQQSKNELGPLFTECAGLQGEAARQCGQAQMSQLGESVSGGVVRGMLKAAQPVLLIVAFGGGLLVGLLLFLALSVVRLHRELGSGSGAGTLRQRRLA